MRHGVARVRHGVARVNIVRPNAGGPNTAGVTTEYGLISAIRAECLTMVASADTRDSSPSNGRGRYLARALRSMGFGIVVGLSIAIIRQQSIWTTLVYSLCISLACWFFIELGRFVLAGLLNRNTPNRYLTSRPGWPGWGWMMAVVCVGSCFGLFGGTELGDLLTGERTAILSGSEDLRHVIADILFVVLPAVVITYFFNSQRVIADREAAAQVAQRQAAESRLRLLEAQLEPHMFFNTLANLHVLIGLDPPRAQAMLDQLISYLRATLSGSRASEHPLRAEFSRTRDYLALMQVRMEDRLQTSFELPDELADIPVPPLLLQPLVENSIKHGLEPSVTGGRIDVRAVREGTTLILSVRDTGVGLRDDNGARPYGGDVGTSFGLQQVRERLATLYGEASSFRLSAADDADGGTLAVIRLPVAKEGRERN